MDLKQIKWNFDNGIITSRPTLVKLVDYAIELESRLLAFQISSEDAKLLAELIDNPYEPNEALKKAFENHQKLIKEDHD